MPPSDVPPPARLRAFTLIELLVVISITALLVGILLPVLGSARQAARTLQCLSNQRQLTIATINYRTDQRGHYPIADTGAGQEAVWFVSLDFYFDQGRKNDPDATGVAAIRNFNEFKQDPIWFTFEDTPSTSSQTIREFNRTFKMNRAFRQSSANPHVRDGEIKNPSNHVLYGDGYAIDLRQEGTPYTGGGLPSRFSIEASALESRIGLRHDGGANIAFADGHASLEQQETRTITEDDSTYEAWFPEFITVGSTRLDEPRQRLDWAIDR